MILSNLYEEMKMRKKIFFILLGIFFTANVHAQKIYFDGMIGRGDSCIITDNNINVRSDCSTNSKVLFQLDAGKIVKVEERCREEMFVEGAWAHWYKISCYLGEGYILGRWMTSVYGECDLRNGGARYDYVACQFLFQENDADCPGEDSGEYIKDEILFIRGNLVRRLTGFSLLKGKVSSYPCSEIQVVQDSGIIRDIPIVLFIKNMGYGAGRIKNCSVCLLTDEKELSEICFAKTVFEIPYFKNQIIYFPDKSYDVYNNEWSGTDLLERGTPNEIVVVTKEGETDSSGNIRFTSEKKSVYRWNGNKFK